MGVRPWPHFLARSAGWDPVRQPGDPGQLRTRSRPVLGTKPRSGDPVPVSMHPASKPSTKTRVTLSTRPRPSIKPLTGDPVRCAASQTTTACPKAHTRPTGDPVSQPGEPTSTVRPRPRPGYLDIRQLTPCRLHLARYIYLDAHHQGRRPAASVTLSSTP
jgi:hypothetical protein